MPVLPAFFADSAAVYTEAFETPDGFCGNRQLGLMRVLLTVNQCYYIM